MEFPAPCIGTFPHFGGAHFGFGAGPFGTPTLPFTGFHGAGLGCFGAGFPHAFGGAPAPPTAPFGAGSPSQGQAPAPTPAPRGAAVGPDGLVPHQDGESNVPTLTYFGNYGLAQAIRLTFVEAGAHFHEREIDSKEDWESLKPQLPFGQLPVVEIDGHVLFQSTAIVRYLGAKYGLAGKSLLETAEVDAILESVKDVLSAFPMRVPLEAIASGQDPVAACADKVEDLRKALAKFEKFLENKVRQTNLPDDAPLFFVGNSLTIADLFTYAYFHLIAEFAGEHGAFEGFPLLQRALDSTYQRPNIQLFLDGERSFPPVPPAEKVKQIFAMLK